LFIHLFKITHSRQHHPPQRHLCALEVEKVHQFHRLARTKSSNVDPLRFVVELDAHRQDVNVLYKPATCQQDVVPTKQFE
jgi:hypothetical protein